MRDLAGFVKMLPGYETPHQAGLIRVTVVRGGNVKDASDDFFAQLKGRYGEVFSKPRHRSGKLGKMKGDTLSAGVMTKDTGLPKRIYVFAAKANPQQILIFFAAVDDREVRLDKKLFKKILDHVQT